MENQTVQIGWRIPVAISAKLRDIAYRRRVSISFVATEALTLYLAHERKKRKAERTKAAAAVAA